MSMPLVSCIMPTKNRREFVPQAIAYFLRQTYPNKRLLIGDDGDSIFDLLVPNVDYRRFSPRLKTIGAKRNALVECCGEGLIAHWDDDDWYGPDRLADQVAAMQDAGAEVCGIDRPRFYDLRTDRSFRYFPRGRQKYAYSATLMYTREYWERSPFPDVQVASGVPFIQGRLDNAAIFSHPDWFVGIAHESNTSPKDFTCAEFKPWPSVEALLGDDWHFYQYLRANMGVAA